MSKFHPRKLAAVCISFFAFCAVHAQPANPPVKGSSEEFPEKLEPFEVTGSRIRRLDAATPQPVVTIGRSEIDASGFLNLQDFLKSLPSNSGTTNQTLQTPSFTRGASTLNPRGLGSQRFLVLINGRRASSYALGTSANNTVFDFNSIPLSAIERIEYLKDGASAIYGADAVTGVYNLVLRKDYQGLEVSTIYGNTTGHDISYREVNVLAGARRDRTQVSVMANYTAQNDSFLRDYERSETSDYSRGGTRVGPQYLNQNSTLNFPFNLILTRAQATAYGFDLTGISGTSINVVPTNSTSGQTSPTVSGFRAAPANTIPNENRYDFARSYQLEPASETYAGLVALNQDFTPQLHGYATVAYNSNRFDYQYTPAAIQFSATSLPSPVANPVAGSPATFSTLFLPANNPYNPFAINLTNLLGRANFGPSRSFDVHSRAENAVVGVKGTVADHFDWDTAYQHGSSSVMTAGRNQIRVTDFQNALLGTTRATALNPFGPSENPEVINKLFTTSYNSGKFKNDLWDFTVSNGELYAMPESLSSFLSGHVGLAAGFEWRQESLVTRPDTQSYIGTGGGQPFQGKRTVQSEYLEMTVPLLSHGGYSAESQLAVRHEKYSDFGDTTKPKFAAKLQFPKTHSVDLLLRGSLSQSFAAPNLGQVYSAQTTGFTSALADPLRPSDPPAQLRTISGGAGPGNLHPEQARIHYYGAVLEVPYVKDRGWGELSFDVDFFDMKIVNVINTPSAAQILSRPDIFPDAQYVVRDNSASSPGPISYIKTTPANVARWKYRGIDYAVEYTHRSTRAGTFTVRASATQVLYVGFNSGIGNPDVNSVSRYSSPRWNSTLQLRWSGGMWRIDNLFKYAGGFTDDLYITQPGNPVFGMDPKITWNPAVTVDLSRYSKGLTVKLGATNVLDTQPNVVGRETTGYDQSVTSTDLARGRFVHLEVRKAF